MPQRAYLGLERAGDFAIAQILAEVLIIEMKPRVVPVQLDGFKRPEDFLATVIAQTGLNRPFFGDPKLGLRQEDVVDETRNPAKHRCLDFGTPHNRLAGPGGVGSF